LVLSTIDERDERFEAGERRLLASFIGNVIIVMTVHCGKAVHSYGAYTSGKKNCSHYVVPSFATDCKVDVESWSSAPNKQECTSPWEGEGSRGWRSGRRWAGS